MAHKFTWEIGGVTINIQAIISVLLLVVVWVYGYNLGQQNALEWEEMIEEKCFCYDYSVTTNIFGQPFIYVNTPEEPKEIIVNPIP